MSARARLLMVSLLTLAGGRAAWAVCNVPSACTFADLVSCCGATSCTIDGTVTVVPPSPGAVCNFDLDSRNLTITATGHFRAGSNTVTITAGSFTSKGELSARGGTSPNPGGNITITTVGGTPVAFSLPTGSSSAVIDLSGYGLTGGGSLTIQADGAVLLDVGNVTLDGLDTLSNGGALSIDSSAGAMRINVPVSANGGVTGSGGSIKIVAPDDLTITKRLSSNGGSSGLGIDLDAGGMLLLDTGSILQASGLPDSEGEGGSIDITAGAVTAKGEIQADGGSAPDGLGGQGGDISIESLTGALNLAGGDITADGAPGGDGGTISLTSDSPPSPNGDITINARLGAIGAASLSDGLPTAAGGGGIEVSAAGSVLLQKTIDVTGAGGGGAGVSLSATSDVSVAAEIHGTDRSEGAALDIEAGHDLIFGADITLKGTIEDGGDGGEIDAIVDNDVRVAATTVLDVSGTVMGSGGIIGFTAGRNVTIEGGATLTASGGSLGGGKGGSITLLAGQPDTTGDLTINGRLIANGTSTGLLGAAASLVGCQVLISGSAVIDTRGDVVSANTVTARTVLTIQNQARIQATNANVLVFRDGSVPTIGGSANIAPHFTPGVCTGGTATAVGAFGTGCAKPACTDRNTPVGCLIPCPQCGDGHVDSPWETCDPGNTTNRCGASAWCNLQCRLVNCIDSNPCSTDDCDDLAGCFHGSVPDLTPCDDDTVCNGREACQSTGPFSICQRGTPLDCDDGNPCTNDCDPVQGCVSQPLSGTSCDNGKVCDGSETCVSGNCRPGTPLCQGQFCNPTNGECSATKACPTGNADCDDGNPCNGSETCVSGSCQLGTPPAEGASCADGNVCNGSETCQSGACVRGPGLDCDDGNVCTNDTCDASGCHHTPIPNCCQVVAQCHEVPDNPCTIEACTDNQCDRVVDPGCCQVDADCDDHDPCTQDSPCVNMHCTHTPLSGSQPGCRVEDDACHPMATCDNGSCNLGAALDCPSDGDVCTNDVCDAVTRCSVPQRIPECCHTVADCDDQNVCTDDECSVTDMRCTHTLRSVNCVPCASDTDCNPTGRCAGGDVFNACGVDGSCIKVAPPDCRDNDTNTRDVCVLTATGQPQCQHLCITNAACDDHDACTGLETCNTASGACVPGTPPACDVCEPCDPAGGCVAKTGVGNAQCQVGVIDAALKAAADTDIKTAVRKRLGKKVQKIIGKMNAEVAADRTGNAKRAGKLRKAARALLGGLQKSTSKALKKNQISSALAAQIQDRAARAVQSL